jgi:hypothetical protein
MPFAFGLAVSFFMIVQKLADRAAGWIYGATVGGSAFLPWYGIGYEYHRIAEHGEDSERFHNFASRVMLLPCSFWDWAWPAISL